MNASPTPQTTPGRPSEHPAQVARVVLPSTRILIVDDELELLDMLTAHFLQSRYEVETATNGIDALATVVQYRPQVVLLDINMPRLNGVEVLKEILKIDQSIAVIVVTGNSDLHVAVEVIRHGAFGYVPKPFDLRYLDHLIAASLGRSAPRR